MSECMNFPKTADEFIEQYKFADTKQEYTNGAELIPVFRVQQMMEHYFAKDNNVPSKWIPVAERLPGVGEKVLVCGCKSGIYTAYLARDGKYPLWHKLNSKSHYCNPTHWMPLPEPPKGE